MAIKIINQSSNPLPNYETLHSAGMDLRANLTEAVEILPLHRTLIPTGLFIALEPGTEAQIRPRSGLAFKQGITVLNSPGTIDADYRGEIKVILVNLSADVQPIRHGDRIAQMVFQKVEKVNWKPVSELTETARNAGGFGHTGKH